MRSPDSVLEEQLSNLTVKDEERKLGRSKRRCGEVKVGGSRDVVEQEFDVREVRIIRTSKTAGACGGW